MATGCSPVWSIGGAYFPAWLVCMVTGLFGALAVRSVFVVLRWDPWIRPRALAYPAMGIFITLLTYLLFFTQ